MLIFCVYWEDVSCKSCSAAAVLRWTPPWGLDRLGHGERYYSGFDFVNNWLIRALVFTTPPRSANSLCRIQSPLPGAKLIQTKLPQFLPRIPSCSSSLLTPQIHSYLNLAQILLAFLSSPFFLPPPFVFLRSVVTGAKLIFPPPSPPAAAAVPPPLCSDTLPLFTSDHNCIYLSPPLHRSHRTSLLHPPSLGAKLYWQPRF